MPSYFPSSVALAMACENRGKLFESGISFTYYCVQFAIVSALSVKNHPFKRLPGLFLLPPAYHYFASSSFKPSYVSYVKIRVETILRSSLLPQSFGRLVFISIVILCLFAITNTDL